MPERKLILATAELGGSADLKKAAEKAGLRAAVYSDCAWLGDKKKMGNLHSSKTTPSASPKLSFIKRPFLKVRRNPPKTSADKKQECPRRLKPRTQQAAEQLKKRKLVTIEPKTTRILQITAEGKKAAAESKIAPQEITQLTPELIITGKWHTTKLQKYNIEAPVAKTWPGKKHPYLQFLDEVRAKLVQLGFQEMTGTSVETSFFNFDALYVPQDHPAREASDIYYIKDPQVRRHQPTHAQALEHVKETHENGWKTGSTGWGYKYSLASSPTIDSSRTRHMP